MNSVTPHTIRDAREVCNVTHFTKLLNYPSSDSKQRPFEYTTYRANAIFIRPCNTLAYSRLQRAKWLDKRTLQCTAKR